MADNDVTQKTNVAELLMGDILKQKAKLLKAIAQSVEQLAASQNGNLTDKQKSDLDTSADLLDRVVGEFRGLAGWRRSRLR